MDIKVYQKEEVALPSGTEYVYVPNVIDLIPITEGNVITGAVEMEDVSRGLLEQECALATIWQRGLDPLDTEDGIEWSETLLGETSVLQLMEDITEAVAKVTTSVTVVFDTTTDANGRSYLTYKLQEVV
nr:MAG TPA: hypothetical protein [Caudoviricetes sp.]